MTHLGIIVLGQTPRPDLASIYKTYLPDVSLSIMGALDGRPHSAIADLAESKGEYPLLVILADGTTREISLYRLLPLLEGKAARLAAAGAQTTVLMCAGDFPDLKSPIPIIYPGRVVPAVAAGISPTRRIGIITPNPGQLAPAKAHWEQKGFTVRAAVASPKKPGELEAAAADMQGGELDLVVLDCMGFGPRAAQSFKDRCGRPVICPQRLVARVTAEIMGC